MTVTLLYLDDLESLAKMHSAQRQRKYLPEEALRCTLCLVFSMLSELDNR